MEKYAVIRLSSKQYRVTEGDEILVDLLKVKKPTIDVLLVVSNGKVQIGTPTLNKLLVKVKIIEDEVKGKKLHVYKFKAKSRYRRKMGFRPKYSKILIEKIG